jgi:DNA primase
MPLSERIKAAAPVRSFVLRYLELSPAGRGLCPFHDDQVASFSVNDAENFWYCFACERGGSIIDFWMAWQEIDFKIALRELAGMLLDDGGDSPEPVDGQALLT